MNKSNTKIIDETTKTLETIRKQQTQPVVSIKKKRLRKSLQNNKLLENYFVFEHHHHHSQLLNNNRSSLKNSNSGDSNLQKYKLIDTANESFVIQTKYQAQTSINTKHKTQQTCQAPSLTPSISSLAAHQDGNYPSRESLSATDPMALTNRTNLLTTDQKLMLLLLLLQQATNC